MKKTLALDALNLANETANALPIPDCAKCGAKLQTMNEAARKAHVSLCAWDRSEMAIVETVLR